MPFGIIVVKWDERLGAVLEAKYPEHVRTTDDQIMKIYTAHALGEITRFLSMKGDNFNVVSYFSGIKTNHYVALLLTPEENAEDYKDGLAKIAAKIFSKIKNGKYKSKLGDLYDKLTKYPALKEEEDTASKTKTSTSLKKKISKTKKGAKQ